MKALLPLLALTAAAVCAPAAAHQYHLGDLNIVHPSSRPAAQGMTGVGYLTVNNSGAKPDVLVKVETPAAAKAEIHVTTSANGVSKMRKLKGGLAIPANGAAKLEPGGAHLMLIRLKQPLAIGDKVPATLVFKNAGRVNVEFLVQRGAERRQEHRH